MADGGYFLCGLAGPEAPPGLPAPWLELGGLGAVGQLGGGFRHGLAVRHPLSLREGGGLAVPGEGV